MCRRKADQGQDVEHGGHVGVVVSGRLLQVLQCLLAEGHGHLVAALRRVLDHQVVEHQGQDVEHGGHVGVVVSGRLLQVLQCLLAEGHGHLVAALRRSRGQRTAGLTEGDRSSSYFFSWFMNSRCFFSSSSWATLCSLFCSFCWVPASSSRSHWFSWHSLLTCARSFCFSDSTELRWPERAIITWGGCPQEVKSGRWAPLLTCASLSPSSSISKDLRMRTDFSSTSTPCSSCFRQRSVPSRPSRMEWCSCFRASRPWITCRVREMISSWDIRSPAGSSSSFTHTMNQNQNQNQMPHLTFHTSRSQSKAGEPEEPVGTLSHPHDQQSEMPGCPSMPSSTSWNNVFTHQHQHHQHHHHPAESGRVVSADEVHLSPVFTNDPQAATIGPTSLPESPRNVPSALRSGIPTTTSHRTLLHDPAAALHAYCLTPRDSPPAWLTRYLTPPPPALFARFHTPRASTAPCPPVRYTLHSRPVGTHLTLSDPARLRTSPNYVASTALRPSTPPTQVIPRAPTHSTNSVIPPHRLAPHLTPHDLTPPQTLSTYSLSRSPHRAYAPPT
ncbi:hypothetical protein CRUP_023015 [Coryphaenoides rupestris]|nr:hypothetical protein CRUP_023015 [Coryphaenoides rupestris]